MIVTAIAFVFSDERFIKGDRSSIYLRYLLERAAVEQPETTSRAIIELVTTIMVYKFEQLSRTELEAILGYYAPGNTSLQGN